MPANLTPEYLSAERRFREAKELPEKIAALEEMLSVIPKHKGTDKMRAELRRKLSKLKGQAQKKGGRKTFTVSVRKEGAGQLYLLGPPNAGKSQLLTTLTNATPEVAPYPFTTRLPQPGMMEFENIQLQLVDAPPIAPGYMESWLPGLLMTADAALLLVDLGAADCLEQTEMVLGELEKKKVRLVREANDRFDRNVRLLRSLLVGNKLDLPEAADNFQAVEELFSERLPSLAFSATEGTAAEELRRRVFNLLGIIRVYCKMPGRKADYDDPVTLPAGSCVLDFARHIHKEMAKSLSFSRIWGTGRRDGERVPRDHVLADGDTVELHL